MIRVLWKSLLYACTLPIVIYLPLILIESDTGELIYWLLLLFISFGASWTVAWTNGWRTGLLVLAGGMISVFISLALLHYEYTLQTPAH